ncbi:MAG: bifunctional methylenetetrahydrofolate dehydrogenase/methenyltetrahydrofolate cyclohydrolase FolD [Parvularculaceae bacterium]
MTAQLIDGKAVAADLRDRIGGAVAVLQAHHALTPGLAVVLVGDDPASHVYVRNKGLATRKAGMRSIEHRLPADAREEEVIALVRALNADDSVDGVLVQMPLPDQIDAHKVINEIDPDKDVDGLTEVNAGRLMLGKTGLEPCTPQGCVILAKTVEPKLSGLNAVVVGRSILVGKPLSMLLLAENCTVTMAHSRTRDLAEVCRAADILCAAVGRAELVKGDWVKEGAIVLDVGINRVEEGGKARLIGDVEFDAAAQRARAITPVPGGVGPMTIACLLKNTVLAAARRRGLDAPDI